MRKRNARITLSNLSQETLKALKNESTRLDISRNEFINRAVFNELYKWACNQTDKEKFKVLKNLLDKDVDLVYYAAKANAIADFLALKEKLNL